MNLFQDYNHAVTRRYFFTHGSHAVGWAALASLLGERAGADTPTSAPGVATGIGAALPRTHHLPKARNVIYLHMVGGPAQMDLYDYKPQMRAWFDRDLPDSIRMG